MINEITEKELSSSGGKPFLVFVENSPLDYNRQNVYVKMVVIKYKPIIQFGYYRKTNQELEFIEIPEILGLIEERMNSSVIAGLDFSSIKHMFDKVDVETNSTLRIINYSRSLFKTLSKSIYNDGVTTSLKAGDMELSVSDVGRLYDHYERIYVANYMNLLFTKIMPYLRRQSNDILKTYLSFKNFIPVLFKGNCVVNPFIDSYKMNRVFLNTDFYEKCKDGMFNISEDSVVYLMTNREICEALKINKYLRFYMPQLTLFLLGLFDENKFPSAKKTLWIDENGQVLREGAVIDGARQISSLYHMCGSYVKFLCPPRMLDEYVSILSTGRL